MWLHQLKFHISYIKTTCNPVKCTQTVNDADVDCTTNTLNYVYYQPEPFIYYCLYPDSNSPDAYNETDTTNWLLFKQGDSFFPETDYVAMTSEQETNYCDSPIEDTLSGNPPNINGYTISDRNKWARRTNSSEPYIEAGDFENAKTMCDNDSTCVYIWRHRNQLPTTGEYVVGYKLFKAHDEVLNSTYNWNYVYTKQQ